MNSDGTDVRQLTDNMSYDWNPSWSPDGSQLAFVSDRLAGEINETMEQIDGEWVIRVEEILAEVDIWRMDADGKNWLNLTDNATGVDGGPSWSPDGSRIAFHSDLGEHDSTEIYVMDADGSDQRRLTSLGGSNWDPKWTPDGQLLVFAGHLREWSLHTISPESADVEIPKQVGSGWKPVWSPQGDRITFAKKSDAGFWDIYVMDADGTNIVQLTANAGDNNQPVWSPSGDQIAFSSSRSSLEEFIIYVMNANGENQISTGQSGFASSWINTN